MARDPLDIIEYAESKGKNVPNYKFGPGFTAQGYYQITNPTWRDFSQAAGVDLSKYPTAMTAPKEVQRAVAEQIFRKRGFQPWEAVKHLRGQEKDYSIGAAPAATYSGATPMTMPGAAPLPPARPAAPTVQTAANIQELQKRLLEKYPELRVTSGYRDPAHNARVGGAKNSQHTHGRAIDISLRGIEEARQREIVEYARTLGARGLGYYPRSQSAHFDVRPGAPVAWGQNYSSSSLPGTPKWFQEVAAQHTRGGGSANTAVATSTPTGAVAAAPAGEVPTLPADPTQGVLASTPDPFKAIADAQEKKQVQQAAALAASQAAAQPSPIEAPAPAPQPMQAPIDYAGLIMPRIKRGLLADDYSSGLLGAA